MGRYGESMLGGRRTEEGPEAPRAKSRSSACRWPPAGGRALRESEPGPVLPLLGCDLPESLPS